MADKLVFLNTGWMDFYAGLKNDTITGGGKHVNDHGWGGEMFNFREFKGHNYGYVQPKIDKKYNTPSIIKLEKIGARESDAKMTGVTVVWTARDPNTGGTYIIGWYKNATVFRRYQEPPANSKRNYDGNSLGYYVTTRAKNARLLAIDERVIHVERQQKNWMGQSNVWYAENNPEFVDLVKNYINNGVIPTKRRTGHHGGGAPRQPDPLKRIEVEKRAILFVTKHYQKLGYKIQSFEKDNVGWDLMASNEKTELKLEVKGLSGLSISAELTPNEYTYLNNDKKFYRLCIATDSLSKPQLKVFSFSRDNNEWTSEDGTVLKFQKVTSARVYV